MRLKVDLKSDALYFRISEDKIHDSEEIKPGIVIDFSKSGKVVGLEVLGLKGKFSLAELSNIQVDLPTKT
ncbi:MAG: DUF2283 domain-containing protein [Candidatus Omnitrophica bacterium]|nr:DUF2283 domain-containing protein [Candidatus Omnitrophota bacterium]